MKITFFINWVMISLIVTSCSSQISRYSNVYCGNPDNRDSSGYLVLNNDKSYYLLMRFGDKEHKPYNELKAHGIWASTRSGLRLYDNQTRIKTEELKIITLVDGRFGLKPTLGDGKDSGSFCRPTLERELITSAYIKSGQYSKIVQIPLSID